MINSRHKTRFGVSLFSGGAIGDLGFRASGIQFVAMAEIEPKRAALARANFPEALVFADGVAEIAPDLIAHVHEVLARNNEDLFLLACTPPCQGMSKSGQGTLLANIKAGKRPRLDPRNRLILDGLDVIEQLN